MPGRACWKASPAPPASRPKCRGLSRGDFTDIGQAIRLGLSIAPQDAANRIVLVSDGNDTVTHSTALAAAAQARQAGVPVYTYTIGSAKAGELWTERMLIDPQKNAEEPFAVKAVVHSESDQDVRLYLTRRGEPVNLAGQADRFYRVVSLKKGPNLVEVLRESLKEGGFYDYEVQVEPLRGDDPERANNRAAGIIRIHGPSKVLIADGSPGGRQGQFLASALKAEQINAVIGNFPASPVEFNYYDAVVLSDTPADWLTRDQMTQAKNWVAEGGGLVWAGGPTSFGPGGYSGTPIEEISPVSCDVKRFIERPSLALAIAVDKSGSMGMVVHGGTTKMDLANEGAAQAVKQLDERDEAGIVPVDTQYKWITNPPIQRMTRADQNRLTSDVPHQPARRRGHLLRHGHPRRPGRPGQHGSHQQAHGALRRFRGLRAAGRLRPVGRRGPRPRRHRQHHRPGPVHPVQSRPVPDGRRDGRRGPVVLHRRPQQAAAGLHPRRGHRRAQRLPGAQGGHRADRDRIPPRGPDPPRAEGPAQASRPGGHHAEGPRRTAHPRPQAGGPAAGQVELRPGQGGRLDLRRQRQRGAPDWIGWEGFGQFWSQVVRWAMRSPNTDSPVTAEATIRGQEGAVTAEAFDAGGNPVTDLSLHAVVESANPDNPPKTVELHQTAPGRYEGGFEADEVGAYVVHVLDEQRGAMDSVGAVMSHSPEFTRLDPDRSAMAQIAAVSGGKPLESLWDPFFPADRAVFVYKPIAVELLAWAMTLFFLDIVVRRFVLPETVLRWLTPARRHELDPGVLGDSAATARMFARPWTSPWPR